MRIGPKTKMDELLCRYSFLKDFLIDMNRHFKALDNPLVKKTLGRMATLSQVAMVGGIELSKLINDIAGEITRQTGEEAVLEGDEPSVAISGPEQKIEALKESIKDLHRGVDVKTVKQRFLELIMTG